MAGATTGDKTTDGHRLALIMLRVVRVASLLMLHDCHKFYDRKRSGIYADYASLNEMLDAR